MAYYRTSTVEYALRITNLVIEIYFWMAVSHFQISSVTRGETATFVRSKLPPSTVTLTSASLPATNHTAMASSPSDPPLMSVLAAETWHRTLSQTDGRDKLFRLVQYVCKLLRGLDAGRGAAPVAQVEALESAMGTSRQIWRLFKWMSVYAKSKSRVAAMQRHASLGTPALPELAAIVSDAALFGYYLMDNITFVHKAKLLPGDVRNASRRAARFWLVAVLAGLAGSLHNLLATYRQHQRLLRALREAKGSEQEHELEAARQVAACARRQRVAMAVCAKHAGDTVVAYSLSKKDQLNPAVVGACGVVSSVVGFWQMWPRYMPTG